MSMPLFECLEFSQSLLPGGGERVPIESQGIEFLDSVTVQRLSDGTHPGDPRGQRSVFAPFARDNAIAKALSVTLEASYKILPPRQRSSAGSETKARVDEELPPPQCHLRHLLALGMDPRSQLPIFGPMERDITVAHFRSKAQ
jgi:hypothetical protein